MWYGGLKYQSMQSTAYIFLRKLEVPQPLQKNFVEKEKRVIYNAKLIYWEKLGGGRTTSRCKKETKKIRQKSGLKSFLAIVWGVVPISAKLTQLLSSWLACANLNRHGPSRECHPHFLFGIFLTVELHKQTQYKAYDSAHLSYKQNVQFVAETSLTIKEITIST
jgi:hypothetical protein